MSGTVEIPANRKLRRRLAALERAGRHVEAPSESTERQAPALRALLLALGFDPDHTRIYRRVSPAEGLLIVDGRGRPLRFYSRRALRALMDESFQREVRALLEGEEAVPAKDPA